MKFSIGRIIDYKQLLKELENGLRKLDFRFNFDSFEINLTFKPGEEIKVTNRLKNTPNYYIIGRQSGEGQIIDGDTPWTSDAIYLKNSGINTITATIVVMR